MEQNFSKKIELKDKLISFYNKNKYKIFFIISILLIFVISSIFIKFNNVKENSLISEKYVQAGLYLASGNKQNSKILYREIINSKNKFYSILSLYTIVEKNLEIDQDKILNLFQIVEEIKKSKAQEDLLTFKKALYLIKILKVQKGNDLLKNLVESNSELKNIAEEILSK